MIFKQNCLHLSCRKSLKRQFLSKGSYSDLPPPGMLSGGLNFTKMYYKPTINLKIGTYHRLAKVQGKTFDDKVDYLLSLIEARKGKFCWYLDVKEYEKGNKN